MKFTLAPLLALFVLGVAATAAPEANPDSLVERAPIAEPAAFVDVEKRDAEPEADEKYKPKYPPPCKPKYKTVYKYKTIYKYKPTTVYKYKYKPTTIYKYKYKPTTVYKYKYKTTTEYKYKPTTIYKCPPKYPPKDY